MKHNERISHKWIYAKEKESYSFSSYKVKFYGNSFYSYSTKLATIDRVNKVILIDLETAKRSNTSNSHYRTLLVAIPKDYKVFEWNWSQEPLDYYLEKLDKLISLEAKARTKSYVSHITKILKEALSYSSVFKLDKKSNQYKSLLKLQSNIDNLKSYAKIRQVDIDKRNEEIKQEEDKAKQNQLDKFTGGGVPYNSNYKGVYLKVVGDNLITSNSVKVNLAEAKLLYKLYSSGKNIIGKTLDQYTILNTNKKEVTIGCTVIGSNELKRILSDK